MQELVLDANALIDLLAPSFLRAVARCLGFRFWVVENVQREVSRPDQRDRLERLLADGIIGTTVVGAEDTTWLRELDTYAHLKRFLGDGEAASLAVARHRGWVFVSYEKGRLRREAENLLGERFWRTPILLAKMVKAKAITVDQLEAEIVLHARRDMSMEAAHPSRLVSEVQVRIQRGEKATR